MLIFILIIPGLILNATETITLFDCIDAGLAGSIKLRNQDYNLQNSRTNLNSGYYSFIPDLNLFSDIIHDNAGNQISKRGVEIFGELHLFDHRFSNLKVYSYENQLAQLELDKTLQDQVLLIISRYTDLLLLQQKAEVFREAQHTYEQQLAFLEELFNAGSKNEFDLYATRLELENARLELKRTEMEFNSVTLDLKQMTDIDLDMGTVLDTLTWSLASGIGDQKDIFNPEIRKKSLMKLAQQTRKRSALKDLFPDLSLQGYYGYKKTEYWKDNQEIYDYQGNFISRDAIQDYWQISLNLSLPLGDFAERSAAYKISDREYRIAENEFILTEREVNRNLQQQRNTLDLKKQEIEILGNRYELAEKKFLLAGERYSSGLINFLDFINIQQEMMTAELDLLESRQEYLNSFVQWQQMCGYKILQRY